MIFRQYQTQAETDIYAAWARGIRNVLAVLYTGAGKTVIFTKIVADHAGRAVIIAHRQELVGQISLTLARRGVYHRIIGPTKVVKFVVRLHTEELGRSYYDPNSEKAVAGVDTLRSRRVQLAPWLEGVTLWVQDEGHHILRKNKWGIAASLMPNAKGLAVTATAGRADGRGLGRESDGLLDVIIEGPQPRTLIDDGWLTDYRVFCPPSDFNVGSVEVSSTTGDFNKHQLRAASHESHIVGDVVEHYLKHAAGKLGITFCVDVQTSTDVAAKFREHGVPAEVVSHQTPDDIRQAVLRRFRRREILQLVNVDLFGEGFDLPAVEVVSFARPTKSFSVYSQQFGRGLRLMLDNPEAFDLETCEGRLAAIAASAKSRAIIIDHVGNCIEHGPPDRPRTWSLERRESHTRDRDPDVVPTRVCVKCTSPYERVLSVCPWCGHQWTPAARNGPEFVEGDLQELDAETLAAMRGDVARVDRDKEEYRTELAAAGVPLIGQMANVKRHVVHQETQGALRDALAWWAGAQRALGRDDGESYRRFYHRFGIDVLSAQALSTQEAGELSTRVAMHLGELQTCS